MLVKSRATRRALREQRRGLKASVGVIVTFRKDLLARWPLLLGALACSLAFAGARLLEPWPLKYIFDNVLAERPLDTPIPGLDGLLADSRMRILAAATIAILVLATLRGIFFAYQTLLTTSVGQDVVLKLRRKVFAKLQQLSPDFHAKNSTGDLLTRLTGDVSALRELLVGALLGILSEGLVLIGFLVVMLLMEWRLAVIAIVAMPLVFGLVTLYSGRIRAATRKQRQAEGELAGRLQEVLSGIHLVQLFAREDEENERLRRLNKRSLRSGMESARLEANLNRSVEISIALTTALTLWVGATQVIAGRMTPGDLIVFIAYMQSFHRPLKRISRVARRASKAAVSVERIMEVLEREPDVRDGTVTAPRFAGKIRLEGVEFSYGEGPAVLRGVDLTVQPGQTVALVGPTGAGKTTLLGLIPRMHDATSGAVRIDGHDVRELTLKSLRDQISVVPQDGMLFGGTVRENIAYGKPDATDAEIDAAARAALIHDVVLALPDGYETILGERGVTFSGGERQRLAIARAIVKDAPIVLLDEPTTGLDAEAERFVVAALERLLEGRTAIVIAHRLSTIRRADVIVVLQAGSIVERGSHAELIAAGGAYGRLNELQSATGSGRLLGFEAAAAARASSMAPARRLAGSAKLPPAVAAEPTPPVREAPERRAWRRLLTSLAAKVLAVAVLGGALAAAAAFGIDRLAQPDRIGRQPGLSSAGSGVAVPARAGRKQATGDDGRSVRTTADRPRTSAAAGERVAAGASRKPPAPRRSFSGPRSGAASLTRSPGAEAKSSAATRVEPARPRGKGHQPSPSEQVQNPPIAPAIPATPEDDPDDRSGPSANEAERDADSSNSGPGSSGAESSGSGDEDEDADGRGRGSGS